MTPVREQTRRPHPFDALATIGCVYLALITTAFAACRYLAILPTGAKRNQDLTFFYASNIVTLTGFEHVNAAIAAYPVFGLRVVGLLVAASALTALIGGAYLLARVVCWRVSVVWLVLYSIVVLGVPMAAGGIIGAFNGVSASAGLGLWARPAPASVWAMAAVGLGAIGTLGVVPLAVLVCSRRSGIDRKSYISGTVLGACLVLIVGTAGLIASGTPWREAGMQSLALRGFGNDAAPSLNATPAMPWVTMVLSLLGTAPGSLAGGLSLLPLVISFRGAVDLLRGRPADPVLGVAIAWMAIYLAAFIGFVIAVAATAPAVATERMLMLVASSLANVGISYEPVGLTGISLFVLSGAMLFGRLLPLVMLAWMACVVERVVERESDEFRQSPQSS